MEKSKLAAVVSAVRVYLEQEEQSKMIVPKAVTPPQLSPWRLFHLQDAMRHRNMSRIRRSKG